MRSKCVSVNGRAVSVSGCQKLVVNEKKVNVKYDGGGRGK